MIRFAALGVLASAPLGCALPLYGQDVDCTKAEVQVELTCCAEQDCQAVDARLTTAHKAAVAVMKQVDANLAIADQGAALALRDGERGWIVYRDANCAAEAWAFHGGSAEPVVIHVCRARVTAARADELETMAKADQPGCVNPASAA